MRVGTGHCGQPYLCVGARAVPIRAIGVETGPKGQLRDMVGTRMVARWSVLPALIALCHLTALEKLTQDS